MTTKISKINSSTMPEDNITYKSVRMLRDGLAIGTTSDFPHLLVRLQGKWRDCGAITNMKTILNAAKGPLVNFHQVWHFGVPINPPRT